MQTCTAPSQEGSLARIDALAQRLDAACIIPDTKYPLRSITRNEWSSGTLRLQIRAPGHPPQARILETRNAITSRDVVGRQCVGRNRLPISHLYDLRILAGRTFEGAEIVPWLRRRFDAREHRRRPAFWARRAIGLQLVDNARFRMRHGDAPPRPGCAAMCFTLAAPSPTLLIS
jgi:hypothetical protein